MVSLIGVGFRLKRRWGLDLGKAEGNNELERNSRKPIGWALATVLYSLEPHSTAGPGVLIAVRGSILLGGGEKGVTQIFCIEA